MITPPAGWYDNPDAAGQRFWDGTAWSDQTRAAVNGDRERHNEHWLGWTLLFGVMTYIALLILLNPHLGGSSSYRAGRLLAPVAATVGIIALVARSSSRYPRWWVSALVVPLVAGGLAVALSAGDLTKARTAQESRGEPVGMISAPGAGAGWTVLDTPESRAEVQRVTQGISDQGGSAVDSVVAGAYTYESVPTSPVFFLGINGDLDPTRSAEEVVKNFLAGAYVVDPKTFEPGKPGGALGCGLASAQGQEWVSCAWVGNKRSVLLRWTDRTVGLDEAAELTRVLRDRATG